MNITRALVLLLAFAAVCHAATPRAIVTVQRQHHPFEDHSCGHSLTVIRQIAIVAVDGHALKSPQQQVSVSPGRHVLSLLVSFVVGSSRGAAHPPLDAVFKPHRYSLDGEFCRSQSGAVAAGVGAWKFLLIDEDQRPPSAKVPKTNESNSSNQSLQPTALWRCASMSILISVFSVGAQPRSQSGG